MKASDQEIVSHEACGHYPHRDWCPAFVGGAGRSDFHRRQQEEQHAEPVASIDFGFFIDEPEQVQHDGPEHACTVQGREETVESLNGLQS